MSATGVAGDDGGATGVDLIGADKDDSPVITTGGKIAQAAEDQMAGDPVVRHDDGSCPRHEVGFGGFGPGQGHSEGAVVEEGGG